jgi:hypothetical protein
VEWEIKVRDVSECFQMASTSATEALLVNAEELFRGLNSLDREFTLDFERTISDSGLSRAEPKPCVLFKFNVIMR